MATTKTPLMLLVLPVPSSEPGPAWAAELVTALGLVDSHNHSDGQGAKVTQEGLQFTDDLDLGGNGIKGLAYVQMSALGAAPQGVDNLYLDASGDLHAVNGAGQDVKLTSGGAINLTSNRGINGQYASDVANPSLFYTTASKRYTATTDGATLAGLQVGDLRVMLLSPAAGALVIGDADGNTVIDINTTTSSSTYTLPAATNNPGRLLVFKDGKGNAAAHPAAINRAGSDTIDGATTYSLNTNWGVLRLISNGSKWLVI